MNSAIADLCPRLDQRVDLPLLQNYKLDRMRAAVSALGHPERHGRSILVAGTNAKGSIVFYLTQLFIRTGLHVGSYFSPHVVHPGERILLNGQSISEEAFEEWRQWLQSKFESLSFFEMATLSAFLEFHKQKVDLKILEVGIGGRLDATNVVDPDISVVGPIGWDHQEILGNTLSAIAREKAGVGRPGRSLWVEAQQEPEAWEALKKSAEEIGAHFRASGQPQTPFEVSLVQAVADQRGEHQARNALLAYRVYCSACEDWGVEPIALELVKDCLLQAQLPARIQVLSRHPVRIVDGAHNLSAIGELRKFLDRNYPSRKFRAVFGMMEDKDFHALIGPMRDILTQVDLISFFPERECSPDSLALKFRQDDVQVQIWKAWNPLIEALDRSPEDVLVFGSFYLAGEFLRRQESYGKSS